MTKTCSCVTDAPCLSHQNHQQLMDIHGAVYIKRNTWFKPQHPYFVCLRYAVSLRPHLLCTSLTSIVYPTIPLRSVCIVGFAFRSQHPNLDNGLINDSNFMRKHMRYYYTALMRFKVLYVDGGFHRPVGDTDVSTSTLQTDTATTGRVWVYPPHHRRSIFCSQSMWPWKVSWAW